MQKTYSRQQQNRERIQERDGGRKPRHAPAPKRSTVNRTLQHLMRSGGLVTEDFDYAEMA